MHARARLAALVTAWLLVWAAMAVAQTVSADRATFGGTKSRPDGTSVRMDGLGTSGGTLVHFGDAEGDVFERLLAVGDIPTPFTRDDIAEAITQAWSFNAGAAFSKVRGTSSPFTIRNSADTRDIVRAYDGGLVRISDDASTLAYLDFESASAGTGTRFWRVGNFNGVLKVQGVDDGYASAADLFTATQVGGVPNAWIVAAGVTAKTATYASQTTGWAITPAGAADFRYLFVNEMHAKSFIADLETALNGGQVVAKSTTAVAQAFTCPSATGTATLWVKDFPGFGNMRVFAANDWVVLRSFSRTDADSDGNTDLTIGDCVGQVSSYTDGSGSTEGTQSWTFTRGSGGNAGAMASSTVVAVDALVVDFGVSGQGFLVASANDGAEGVNAPYWQVVTWTTAPVAANMTVQTRWGQLSGAYNYGSSTYGFAAGPSTGQHVTVDPTNGFRIQNATTTWGQMDSTGLKLGVTAAGNGNIFADTSGNLYFRSGTTNKITMSASTGNMSLSGNLAVTGSGSFVGSGITLDTTGIRASVPSGAYETGSAYRFSFANSVSDGGLYGQDTTTASDLSLRLVGDSAPDDYRITFVTQNNSFGTTSQGLVSGPTGVEWSASINNTGTGQFNSLVLTATSLLIDGNTGETQTITVRNALGTGTCTIQFVQGIKVGGTCS